MADSKFFPSLKRWLSALGRSPPREAADGPDAAAGSLTPIPLDDEAALGAASLQRAYRILRAKRGDRALLARADIDPGELVFALPLLALIEVHHEPLRFRHRLVGTGFRETLGFEATGLWLDEWPQPQQRNPIEAVYRRAAEAGISMSMRHDMSIEGQPVRYEALIEPLAADGATVDMLLVVVASVELPGAG